MTSTRRKQVLTDEAVQGELLFRAMVYWFFCLMVVSFLVLGWSLYVGPPRPLHQVVRDSLARSAPAIFASVLLLPLVLIDVLRVSSRFVGPMQQIRHAWRKLAAGEPTSPVALRKADFWQDLADYTNQVAARLDGQHSPSEVDDIQPSPEVEEHASDQLTGV